MKRITCLLLVLIMSFSLFSVMADNGEKVLKPSDIDFKNGNFTVNETLIKGMVKGDYFGFKEVDLTGINSVEINLYNGMHLTEINGDSFLIMIDSPTSGKVIGTLIFSPEFENENVTVKAAIEKTEGVHDLYFYSLYGSDSHGNFLQYKEITLSKEVYQYNNKENQVPDSYIKDFYSDTWVATDSFGRAVATYEETGGVKEGKREVGMMYWNWRDSTGSNAVSITDLLLKYPEAKKDYFHEVWDLNGIYFWGEPVLGFYDSNDYWVYRKHAEMLAIAGVDAVFLDFTNNGVTFQAQLYIMAKAFRDAKFTGIDVPKISYMSGYTDRAMTTVNAIYHSCFLNEDFSDIWYHVDGKPMILANGEYDMVKDYLTTDAEKARYKEASDFFTFKQNGKRKDEGKKDEWMWLETFPQVLRDYNEESGRYGFVAVGLAINDSTIYGTAETGALSDEYAKGRAYSEAFGEDYSKDGMRQAYFFREQMSLALDVDPEFIMFDGWNEWDAIRYEKYGRYKNAFVDQFDAENSRDFEPMRGSLKDDYYMLLVDAVRKYKGVRPAPLATGAKTINIDGDVSDWEGVGPEFFNFDQNYERDKVSYGKYKNSEEKYHYTTKISNAIKGAKVSFDENNLYFLVNAENDIKTDGAYPLVIYINSDRNYSTGYEGYDYALNLGGMGKVSKFADGAWGIADAGVASYSIKGNALQIAVSRSLLGETGSVDLEFKITDGVDISKDFLNVYSEGSAAPYGRFNYLYTEIGQVALEDSTRNALKATSTSVLKAGSTKLIANGAKRYVDEKDIRNTLTERNGTLYVTEDVFNEIMEYGHSKTEYNPSNNKFYTYHYDLSANKREIVNNIACCTTLGSYEVKINGKMSNLTAPVIYENERFLIPLTLISDCYGWEVKSLGNGIYTVSKTGADMNMVNSVINHFN